MTLIPLYTLIVQLGLIDTYWALILPYLFNATAILMMRQFFLQIPQSLIDSARMDGMSELRITLHDLLAAFQAGSVDRRDIHVHGRMEQSALAFARPDASEP